MTMKILICIAILFLGWDKVFLPILRGFGKVGSWIGRTLQRWHRETLGTCWLFLIPIGMVVAFSMIASLDNTPPEVKRLTQQSYVGLEPSPEIRMERLKALATRFPKDEEAQKCIRNHTYSGYEPESKVRELANQLAEKLP